MLLPHCDAIADATVEAFATQGHVCVRDLFDPTEVTEHVARITEAGVALAYDKRPIEERDTYGKAFLQSFNLWRSDSTIAEFVLAPRFAAVAAELLGVDGVRLYHDQGLFKEPQGGRTPWHQDQFYWPLSSDQTVTVWIPLVDVPAKVGSMTFVDGSHRMGDLRGREISDASDEEFGRLIGEQGLSTTTHGALAVGDVTFHHGWTIHSAPANPTDRMRPVMTMIYFADGTRVSDPPLTDHEQFDRQMWLGGAEPGALIDGEANPLLWPR